jgi:hypothetical protein
MRIRMHWTGRRPASGSDARLEQFRRVLSAALATIRYRPTLEAAGLDTPQAIAGLASIPEALCRLPYVGQEDYRSALADFQNPAAPAVQPRKFRFPFEPAPRTAVLMPGFEQSGPVRVFAGDWGPRLERYRPEALAAPAGVLRHLAQAAARGRPSVPPPQNALVVFTGVNEDEMDDQDRDLFWEVFQVPLFEQYLGFDGQVVAWECEAHEGLHVEETNAVIEQSPEPEGELVLTSLTDLRRPALRVRTGVAGRIEHSVCECGRKEPRLTGLCRVARRLSQATCAAD